MATDPVAQEYVQQSRDFLEKARQYLADDDLHEASEKGWDAASRMTEAVAYANGWEYGRDYPFNVVINNISQQTGRNDVLRLRAMANDLRENYCIRKRFLDAREIGIALDDVQALLDILEPLALASP